MMMTILFRELIFVIKFVTYDIVIVVSRKKFSMVREYLLQKMRA